MKARQSIILDCFFEETVVLFKMDETKNIKKVITGSIV